MTTALPSYTTSRDVTSNHVHILASSNSKRALKLDGSDRRWFIPEMTELRKPREYWAGLHEWLEAGGLSYIHQWANDFVAANKPVLRGELAPATASKRKSIVAAMSEGERLVNRVGYELATCLWPVIIRFDHLRTWLAQEKSNMPEFGDGTRKLETPETIARVLRGASIYGNLFFPTKQFKADKEQFRVVTNFPVPDGAWWRDIERHLKSPDDLLKLEEHGAATPPEIDAEIERMLGEGPVKFAEWLREAGRF